MIKEPEQAVADTTEVNFADIDQIVAKIGSEARYVIPVLEQVQRKYNYLPEAALRYICTITDISPADIIGVSSFYSSFRHTPAGKHLIKVCTGTACHVKGASRIKEAILRFLNVEEGSDSDSDGLFTITEVACLGCCTLAPAVQIDDVTYGHLTPNNVGEMIDDFVALQKRKKDEGKVEELGPDAEVLGEVRVGLGSCCIAGGSLDVRNSLEKEIQKLGAPIRIKTVGCVGMCHRTPLVEIIDKAGDSTLYAKVDPLEAPRIIRKHFQPKGLGKRLKHGATELLDKLLSSGQQESISRYSIDVRDEPVQAFLGKQKHIATANCGNLDPLDFDEYLRNDGYKALQQVLKENKPESIIESILESGLRGRGGAGFPTGRKWGVVRQQKGDKYIVMNGDEGDPGAFMDRMLLESFPFRILEGISIAAFAIGVDKAELYIREEYPLALLRINDAIEMAKEKGYLGENIFGSGFSLDIHIMEGAGAFVCGEETALLESIEGKRGTPRLRPPYPAERGLWNKPTLVNNVETYACVPWIIREGADKFAALGTEKSKGTKVFSLTGKINRGGLIEVPMGITVREIVEEIGGGIQDGRKFKAVQIGGPSGGCIPEFKSDIPIDFEQLISVGAIMGSGGLVVLDDSDCMVDVAKYFLEFTQDQSCGKCTYCRIGTKRMLEILTRLCEGQGKKGDLEELEHLALITKKGSLCGLGQTAPNPVLSTLRYYREEYEAHIDGKCPAGKCTALIKYFITTDCIGCTKCAQVCPVDAITMTPYERHVIDDEKCTRCDMCRQGCPEKAVKVGSK